MFIALLTILFILNPGQGARQISDAQKEAFINLIKTLPAKEGSYTDEAVKKAGAYLPTLFALTEKDLLQHDISPFVAISRALSEHAEYRGFAVRHFPKIAHPELKLIWAARLFDAKATSPEIEQFLREALKDRVRAKKLAEVVGPRFTDFRRRVLSSRP